VLKISGSKEQAKLQWLQRARQIIGEYRNLKT